MRKAGSVLGGGVAAWVGLLQFGCVGGLIASAALKSVFADASPSDWGFAIAELVAAVLLVVRPRYGGGVLVVLALLAIVWSYLSAGIPCGCFGGDLYVSPRGRRILACLAGLCGAVLMRKARARGKHRLGG
jgi:hypothetical protein